MKIFHYQDVEAKEAEENASKLRVRWLITKETGAENFAMRLFEMEAGGYSPFHSHPWEHEVFILEGRVLRFVREKKESLELAMLSSFLQMRNISSKTTAKRLLRFFVSYHIHVSDLHAAREYREIAPRHFKNKSIH